MKTVGFHFAILLFGLGSFSVPSQAALVYGGVTHTAVGQARVRTQGERLLVENLGTAGNDGLAMDLPDASDILLSLVPHPNQNNTCIVTRVEWTLTDLGARGASLATWLGGASPIVQADFSALGSTQSWVEVRGDKGELVEKFTVDNNAVVNIRDRFPLCVNPQVVCAIGQGPNYTWWKICKPECGPCIGTNCWLEQVICIRAILVSNVVAHLQQLDLRAQGRAAPSSLELEHPRLSWPNLPLGHSTRGSALLERRHGKLRFSSAEGVAHHLRLSATWEPSYALLRSEDSSLRTRFDPLVLDLKGDGLDLAAQGRFNGVDAPLGRCTLRREVESGPLECSADFSDIGGRMVQVELWEGSRRNYAAMLAPGNLGQVSPAAIVGCGKLEPRPLPCFWLEFDRRVVFTALDGSSGSGTELRILANNAAGIVESLTAFEIVGRPLQDLSLTAESAPPATEFLLADDFWPPASGVYFNPKEYTARFQQGTMVRNIELKDWQGGVRLGNEEFSLDFRCLAVFEYSGDFGQSWLAATGAVDGIFRGAPTGSAGEGYDVEIVALNLAGQGPLQGAMIRESPTLPSLGRITLREVEGGYMVDSFFDVFLELKVAQMPWSPADSAVPLSLRGASRHDCEPARLSIERTADGNFRLCWPHTAESHSLEVAPRLGGAQDWTQVGDAPVLGENGWCVVLEPQASPRFYRLVCRP